MQPAAATGEAYDQQVVDQNNPYSQAAATDGGIFGDAQQQEEEYKPQEVESNPYDGQVQ